MLSAWGNSSESFKGCTDCASCTNHRGHLWADDTLICVNPGCEVSYRQHTDDPKHCQSTAPRKYRQRTQFDSEIDVALKKEKRAQYRRDYNARRQEVRDAAR